MININVFSEEKAWSKRLKNKDIFFKKICKAFPKKYKFSNKKVSFTLLLSNNKNIRKLNKIFRKKNKSTDVLSFPFYNKKELKIKLKSENEIYLGDIVVNLNKIKYKKNKKNFRSEFNKLWVHGLVHLFGHDHKKDKEYIKMLKVEKKNSFLFKLNDRENT